MKQILQSATINTWISIGVRIGGLALLLPIVLTHLDLNQVLIWQLQSSIMVMMLWIDFGITPTFSRFIAVARGGGSLQELQQTVKHQIRPKGAPDIASAPLNLDSMVSTSGRVYLIMALVGTLLIALIGTLVMMGPVTTLSNPNEGWQAWMLTLVAVPFASMNGYNASVLVGCDRIARLRQIESVIGLLQIFSTCLVVIFTANLVWIAASYTFWTIVSFAVNSRYRKIVLHDQKESEAIEQQPKWNPELFRVAWAAGWRSGIGVLFSTGIIQGSGMVMPQIASVEVSAAYLLTLRLVTIASQMSQAPFYSRLPTMAKVNAEGNRVELIKLAKKGLNLSFWTMTAGIFAILFIFPQVLLLIDGSVQMTSPMLSLMLSLAFFAERYGGMHMQLYTLSNQVIWHRINGFTGIFILLAFALLWPFAGPHSMPLAMLAGYGFYLCPLVSHKSLAFIGQERWRFERETSLGPIIALLALSVLHLLLAWQPL